MARPARRILLAVFALSALGSACADDAAGVHTPVDPCQGVTCDGAGTCAITGATTATPTAICVCNAGFVATAAGVGCDPIPATDPCDPNPCTALHQTVCAASGATAVCSCDPGTVVDADGHCVVPPGNPCDPNPCTAPHATTCTVDAGDAHCACDAGYAPGPNGPNGTPDTPGPSGCVTTQVDPCDPNPCTAPGQGICTGLGDGTHRCDCSPGYLLDGDGSGCHLPDPCAPNPCTEPHRGECTVGTGGQVVCACDAGYEANPSGSCFPVDPCTPNPCTDAHRGLCTRGVGDTAICACDAGYRDNAGSCIPVDPCDPNPCTEPHRTLCSADDAGAAACGCDAGYVDNSGSCVPEVVPDCAMAHSAPDAYESDDCAEPATPIDRGQAVAGVSQSHTLDVVGDVDWFALACAARDTLSVEVTGLDSMHTLYAADGTTVLWAIDSQSFRYRCTTELNPYLRVRHYSASGTGSYTIALGLLPDDQVDMPAQGTAVQPGTPKPFTLEGPGDIDAFTLQAVLGHQYEVTVTGADTVIDVRDPAGNPVVSGDAQTMRLRATAAGPYTFAVSLFTTTSWDDGASLLVTDLGPDDHPDAPAQGALVPTDDSVTGLALAVPNDVDAFRFACAQGHGYEIVVEGADTRTEVYDPSGTRVIDSDAQTVRVASTGGTCGLVLRLYTPSMWDDTVTVRVRDLGADDAGATSETGVVIAADAASHAFALAVPGDVDAFRFPALAHHAYQIAVDGADTRTILLDAAGQVVQDTDNQALFFFAGVDGVVTFQVKLFLAGNWDDAVTVVVTDLGLDTHGWDAATATTVVTDGTSKAGAFEVAGDVDWFTFSVDAGHAGHILSVVVTGTSVAYTLYAADGVTPITSRAAATSFIELAQSGTYLLALRQDASARANYTIAVTDLGLDDQGDTSATATASLVVDAAATAGHIEQPGDIDVFAVELGAAQAYAVETTGITTSVAVYTAAGVKLADSTNNPLLFTSGAAGTHYIHVRHATTSGYGAYTVRVRR